jgi:hypothetical protein
MKKFVKYLIIGMKYFLFQTLLEVCVIVLLLYLGIPFFEMNVGNEHFYEIVIGVLGFYALLKCIYYSWIYLSCFIGISIYRNYETPFAFSIVNAVLSIIYILIFLINGRPFSWVLNQLIATVVSSILIVVIVKLFKNWNRHAS